MSMTDAVRSSSTNNGGPGILVPVLIAVGVVVALIALVGVALFCVSRRKRQQQEQKEPGATTTSSYFPEETSNV